MASKLLLQFRFCPSIFLYLSSVCPSIWLIELDKLDTRLAKKESLESLEVQVEEAVPTLLTSTSTSGVPLNQSSDLGDLGVLKDVGVNSHQYFYSIVIDSI
jgi:hypothetical protein